MSDLEQAVRTCRKQRSYLSRQLAANTAWLLRAALIGPPMEPYRCSVCADWHLRKKRSD